MSFSYDVECMISTNLMPQSKGLVYKQSVGSMSIVLRSKACVPFDQCFVHFWIKEIVYFGSMLDMPFMSSTFPGYNYLYPSFRGYILVVTLLFPLICPRKVVHVKLWIYKSQ